MSAYIPTTETVRAHYAESLSWDTDGKEEQDGKWEGATYQFDRWHQAELRKARAEALRDAADMLYEYQWPPGCGRLMGPPDEQAGWMHGADDAHELFDRLLRDRADRIEEDQ